MKVAVASSIISLLSGKQSLSALGRQLGLRQHLLTPLLDYCKSFYTFDFFSILITLLIYSKKMPKSKIRQIIFLHFLRRVTPKNRFPSLMSLVFIFNPRLLRRLLHGDFFYFFFVSKMGFNRTFLKDITNWQNIKRHSSWPYNSYKISAINVALVFPYAGNTGHLDNKKITSYLHCYSNEYLVSRFLGHREVLQIRVQANLYFTIKNGFSY